MTRPSGATLGSERGAAAVVLEAGEDGESGRGVGLDDHLADQPTVAGARRRGRRVRGRRGCRRRRPRSWCRAAGSPAHTAKIDRAAGPARSSIAPRDARMPVGGHHLSVVLAAAEQVDVERRRGSVRRPGPRRARRRSRGAGTARRARPRSRGRRRCRAARGRRARRAPRRTRVTRSPGSRWVNWVYDAMMCTSPASRTAACERVGLDDVLDAAVVEPHRDVEGTLAARGDRLPRNISYGTSQSHDGSRPSATCAFTASTTRGGVGLEPAQHLGPARRVLGEQHPRVAAVREATAWRSGPTRPRPPRMPATRERRVAAEVRDRGGERQCRVHPVPVAGQRELRARSAPSGVMQRVAVESVRRPRAGRIRTPGSRTASAVQSSSAAHSGQVAASERQGAPSATHVTWRAGPTDHTTCGSEALATTARSGCSVHTARHGRRCCGPRRTGRAGRA